METVGHLENEAIAFLSGNGVDSKGRTLKDYLAFTPEQWEQCHDHIQWAFPSVIRSRFNPDGPVISEVFINNIEGNSRVVWNECRHNMIELLARYKNSIGLYGWIDGAWATPAFEIESWASDGFNHNFNRITRILLSQRLFSLESVNSSAGEALSFHSEILPEIVYPFWHNDALRTAFGFWMEAYYCATPWSFGK